MYPHIYEINPATRCHGKIVGQYTVHLLYRFRATETAVCRSHSTVRQSNHFTTVLRTSEFTQVSLSSSTVTKGHFSWYSFLSVWKHLLFAGDGFAGAWSIGSAMLSLEHETFLQMALWFRRSIRLAASQMRCSLRETLEKLFFASCLSHMCRALPRANLHIPIFRACATRPKVAPVSSGKNRKGHVCLLLLFSWMTESGTFERLSLFPGRLIDFHDFQEQIRYSHNGRHVWHDQSTLYSHWPIYIVHTLTYLHSTHIDLSTLYTHGPIFIVLTLTYLHCTHIDLSTLCTHWPIHNLDTLT